MIASVWQSGVVICPFELLTQHQSASQRVMATAIRLIHCDSAFRKFGMLRKTLVVVVSQEQVAFVAET